MTFAVLALLVALVCHIQAARIASRQNDGSILPHVTGPYRVRPTKRARQAQTAGWLLSIYAALTIADSFWLTQPWLSMGIAIAVIVVVNGAPSLLITIVHNRKLQPQG
ncbi:MAG: hypothetical protein WBB99_06060 [Rhodococcus sp. (in: high G+C Gram-positive bacteria)]